MSFLREVLTPGEWNGSLCRETPLDADVSYRSREQLGKDVDFGLRPQVYILVLW